MNVITIAHQNELPARVNMRQYAPCTDPLAAAAEYRQAHGEPGTVWFLQVRKIVWIEGIDNEDVGDYHKGAEGDT